MYIYIYIYIYDHADGRLLWGDAKHDVPRDVVVGVHTAHALSVTWGMVFAQSSSSHPSSMRSSISSLFFSSFFGKGGDPSNVITSFHHCRIWGLLPAILNLFDQ